MNVKAQVDDIDAIKDNIEKYIENTESNADYTDLYDQIEILIKHPVNLNTANAELLAKLPLITPGKIQAIINHRQTYGKLTSLYELQLIEGFSLDYIKLLLPFVSIHESISLNTFTAKSFWKNAQHEIIVLTATRVQKSAGYTLPDTHKNAYLGSPIRQVIRYRGNINQYLQINFNAEKDAGEQLDLNTIFYSGNIIFKGKDYSKKTIRLKFLALGDYQAAFGQGLTLGTGLAFGKSPFVMNIMRTQNGLRSYRAFNENEFLRGAGSVFAIGKYLELATFYSSKRIDATANNDSIISDGFSSIINTGYHRSVAEIEKKGSIKRQIVGSHLTFKTSTFNLGITAVNTQLNESITDAGFKPYQAYNFRGNNITNYGADYKWYVRNLLLFGEISTHNEGKAISYTNGAILSLDKNIDLSFLYRNFSVQANPQITNALGESSDNKNETGFYTGLSITPYKNYKINAYSDIYYSKWLRYQIDAPSRGKDMMAELQYSKRKSYTWYLRYRNEQKQKNQTEIQTINPLENNKREQLRFHIDYILSPKVSLRNRVEQVWYKLQYGKTSKGILLFQDITYKPFARLSVIARYMFFDIENYNSRLYTYENDMLYSFTVPAFQNRGTRLFLLCKYKILKGIDIWLRWARTSYENINEISSGQDKIQENKTTDIKFQIRWTL